MSDEVASSREQLDRIRAAATPRRLILLRAAILRHAPFGKDGRTMWELVRGYPFFWYRLRQSDRLIDAHRAIETYERFADGDASAQGWEDAAAYFRYAEWAAEADMFDTGRAIQVPPTHAEWADQIELLDDPGERRRDAPERYGVAYQLRRCSFTGAERLQDLHALLDYYLVNYDGRYYCWANSAPLHADHHAVALRLIDDIFGDHRGVPSFDPAWLSADAAALARTGYEARDFAGMPVLADALEEAGCADARVLAHCREPGLHARGCWVVDLVLGKQ